MAWVATQRPTFARASRPNAITPDSPRIVRRDCSACFLHSAVDRWFFRDERNTFSARRQERRRFEVSTTEATCGIRGGKVEPRAPHSRRMLGRCCRRAARLATRETCSNARREWTRIFVKEALCFTAFRNVYYFFEYFRCLFIDALVFCIDSYIFRN